jgi:hypothetical protein
MLRRMKPAAALLPFFLLGCPADDAWMESLDDSSSTSGDASASASASASATMSASASATGSATSTGTETDDGSGTAATTTTATTADTSATTSADSTTGTGECAEGSEPAEITEIEECDGPVGEPFCSEGQMHVPQDSVVEWDSDPPHSGPHYPTWETWDEHDTVVPRGNWVHNLEHGGIVLAYRCNDDCEPELDVLRDVLAQRPELRILLTPDPLLPGDDRFAAISWTWVYRFDAPDLDTLLCFADQHENHAPEDVP